jgi:hypothetical protein
VTADHAAEVQVLGAMLQSRDATATAIGLLATDDFDRGTHRLVWTAIVDLHTAGQPVDPVTVTDRIVADGHGPDIAHGSLIFELSASVPHAMSVAHHAGIVARHAERRRQRQLAHALGLRADDPQVDPIDTEVWLAAQIDRETGRRRTIPLLVGEEIDQLPDPRWLIDDYLPQGLSVIYGRPGSAKSFLAMAWACSIASGSRWHGRPAIHAPVVYVVAEGANGAKRRRRAWMASTHTVRLDHLAWVPTAVDPANPADASALARHVEKLGAGLVVFDTLARCMTGEENSTEAMGAFVAGCDRLRERTGTSVLVVHHSDKHDTSLRGNSSLEGAADGIVHMRSNADRTKTLRVEKAKEAEPPHPIDVELRQFGESAVLVQVAQQRLASPVDVL